MLHKRLLRPIDYHRTRWANDGGWTSEITRDHTESNVAFNWRISIAEIESDGPFSHFPGVTRDLLLLEGNGIELHVDAQAPIRLIDHLAHLRFDGASSVDCRLVDGSTRDFNVMSRNDWGQAEINIHRSAATDLSLALALGDTTIVHVVSEELVVGSADWSVGVATGETLRIDAVDAGVESLQLRGPGDAIVVRLTLRA